jgi:hypothetical protein
MSSSRRRAFYYQANANAFGGRLDQPFEQVLPVLAPTSFSRSPSGSFTTLATSVVEGLNVNNVLFADRIVAQISTSFSEEHPYPKVSFLGTAFEGLRIGGLELEPVFNLGICDGGTPEKYPPVSALHNRDFHAQVRQQTEKFREFLDGLPREERARHEWVHDYADAGNNTEDEISKRGSLLCSVVEGIETAGGSLPGAQVGHAIHIPDFGRIFLAELIVGHHSFDLTMIRLELGCPVSGTVSVAQSSSSGTQVAPRGSGGAGHGLNATATGTSGTLPTVHGGGAATAGNSPPNNAAPSKPLSGASGTLPTAGNAPPSKTTPPKPAPGASGTLPTVHGGGGETPTADNAPPSGTAVPTPAPGTSPIAPRGSGGAGHG